MLENKCKYKHIFKVADQTPDQMRQRSLDMAYSAQDKLKVQDTYIERYSKHRLSMERSRAGNLQENSKATMKERSMDTMFSTGH